MTAAAGHRRREAALAGHTGDEPAARRLLGDDEPTVRATALGALARLGALTPDDLVAALADPAPAVRRRACEEAAVHPGGALRPLLDDADASVVEVAAFALGERRPVEDGAVDALAAVARDHDDPLCRESAVAALGAIGDPAGLPAVLRATTDRSTVRRRAVIALAAFDGPEVEAALRTALGDRDRQVRQAAEDLIGLPPP